MGKTSAESEPFTGRSRGRCAVLQLQLLSPGYALLNDGDGRQGQELELPRIQRKTTNESASCSGKPDRALVGDFAGPKAIRAVGQYLKDHGVTVHVFYISNVEDYIQARTRYVGNIASLPRTRQACFSAGTSADAPEINSIADFLRNQRAFTPR